MTGAPRPESPLEPPWWRPWARGEWRLARERRIAYHDGFRAGCAETLGEVYGLLQRRGYFID